MQLDLEDRMGTGKSESRVILLNDEKFIDGKLREEKEGKWLNSGKERVNII